HTRSPRENLPKSQEFRSLTVPAMYWRRRAGGRRWWLGLAVGRLSFFLRVQHQGGAGAGQQDADIQLPAGIAEGEMKNAVGGRGMPEHTDDGIQYRRQRKNHRSDV